MPVLKSGAEGSTQLALQPLSPWILGALPACIVPCHNPCWHLRELGTPHHHIRAVLRDYSLSNAPSSHPVILSLAKSSENSPQPS